MTRRSIETLEQMQRDFLETVWSLSHYSMWGEDEIRFDFRTLQIESGLPRDFVRALCRRLTDAGLMEYSSGLWSEEGMPCGSGYGLTTRGVKWCEENI